MPVATVKRDYYEILGVTRTSDGEEIKRAYRRLAMKYHPDRNQGESKSEAEIKFKECAEAYETLAEPAKRQRNDKFSHNGVARMGHHDFTDMNVGDIFSMCDEMYDSVGCGFGRAGGGRAGRTAAHRPSYGFDLE